MQCNAMQGSATQNAFEFLALSLKMPETSSCVVLIKFKRIAESIKFVALKRVLITGEPKEFICWKFHNAGNKFDVEVNQNFICIQKITLFKRNSSEEINFPFHVFLIEGNLINPIFIILAVLRKIEPYNRALR